MTAHAPAPKTKALELRLKFDDVSYALSVPAGLNGDSHSLAIRHWHRLAPPRILLDGSQINRGPGLCLQQKKKLPVESRDLFSVLLQQGEVGFLDTQEPVRVFVDDEFIEYTDGLISAHNHSVLHHARLPIGLHRIVIVSNAAAGRWSTPT